MGFSNIPFVGGVRRRYAVKLVLLLLVVAIVIGGFGGLIYAQTDASLQTNTKQSMEHATVLQANTLSERIGALERETALLAESDAVRSGEPNRIDAFIESQQEEMGDAIVAVHYVDGSNELVVRSTLDELEGQDAHFPWVHAGHGEFEPTLVGPYEDPHLNAQLGALVVDVDEDMRLAVLFDLATLSATLDSPTQSASSFTHVVDENWVVVLSHDTDTIGKLDHHHMELESEFAGRSGYLEIDMSEMDHGEHADHGEEDSDGDGGDHGDHGEHDGDGEHGDDADGHDEHASVDAEPIDREGHDGVVSMGYAQVEGTDWIIMTHEPRSAAFALQTDVTRSVIGLVLVSFLGLGLIGTVVGRSTSRSLTDLAGSAAELEEGNLDVDLETRRRDEIGQLYGAFDSMRVSLKESIDETEAARDRAERRGEELAELASHLQSKAEEFRDVMEAAGDGDLTARMDADSENQAMREIATEYNRMMTEIEATTAHLKQFADDVAAHGEEVTASAEEVQTASGQVTESVQQISDSTEDQHETFRVVVERMEGLSATTEEIASLSNSVTSIAEKTAETGDHGRTAASEAIQAMDHIDGDAEAAVAEIERLQSQIETIEEITEFITEVARQTNMLALNANIEATRGGESGEGFSVVASEVKGLAAETQESAEEIEELVQDVRRQTDRTAAEVRATREEIDRTGDTVADAVDALDEIAQYAQQTYGGTEEINAATQQQAASIEEVVGLVDDAERLSRRVTGEASTAAAAAEEQTSALSEVTRSAGDLAERSRVLQEHLDEFETERTVDPTPDANGASSAPTVPDADDASDTPKAPDVDD